MTKVLDSVEVVEEVVGQGIFFSANNDAHAVQLGYNEDEDLLVDAIDIELNPEEDSIYSLASIYSEVLESPSSKYFIIGGTQLFAEMIEEQFDIMCAGENESVFTEVAIKQQYNSNKEIEMTAMDSDDVISLRFEVERKLSNSGVVVPWKKKAPVTKVVEPVVNVAPTKTTKMEATTMRKLNLNALVAGQKKEVVAPKSPVAAPAVNTTKEEVTMTTTTTTGKKKFDPSKSATTVTGTVSTATQSGKSTSQSAPNARKVFKSIAPTAKAVQQPWFLSKMSANTNILGESIFDNEVEEGIFSNPHLGISMAAFLSSDMVEAGMVSEAAGNTFAVQVELTMANGNITVPFRISMSNSDSKDTIWCQNIESKKTNAGKWYKTYKFSTRNDRIVDVVCACGEVSKNVSASNNSHKCKCGKEINFSHIAYTEENGTKTKVEVEQKAWVSRNLPYGFRIEEDVLAQVMVFAYYALGLDQE